MVTPNKNELSIGPYFSRRALRASYISNLLIKNTHPPGPPKVPRHRVTVGAYWGWVVSEAPLHSKHIADLFLKKNPGPDRYYCEQKFIVMNILFVSGGSWARPVNTRGLLGPNTIVGALRPTVGDRSEWLQGGP